MIDRGRRGGLVSYATGPALDTPLGPGISSGSIEGESVGNITRAPSTTVCATISGPRHHDDHDSVVYYLTSVVAGDDRHFCTKSSLTDCGRRSHSNSSTTNIRGDIVGSRARALARSVRTTAHLAWDSRGSPDSPLEARECKDSVGLLSPPSQPSPRASVLGSRNGSVTSLARICGAFRSHSRSRNTSSGSDSGNGGTRHNSLVSASTESLALGSSVSEFGRKQMDQHSTKGQDVCRLVRSR
jgi:hypothetical protein